MRTLLAIILSGIVCVNVAFAQDCPVPPGSFDIWGPGADSGLLNQFSTHREAEQHYYSCALSNFQLFDAKTRCEAELAEFKADPECKPIQRGELWKPVSESHGTPVILVSSELQGESVVVEDIDGNIVDTTLRTNCCANGGRYHAYFKKKCSTYPSPVFVRFSGGTCREIPTPCDRIE